MCPTTGTNIQLNRFLAVFLFLIFSFILIHYHHIPQGFKPLSNFSILSHSFIFIHLQPPILGVHLGVQNSLYTLKSLFWGERTPKNTLKLGRTYGKTY